jgi:hypothetical protein
MLAIQALFFNLSAYLQPKLPCGRRYCAVWSLAAIAILYQQDHFKSSWVFARLEPRYIAKDLGFEIGNRFCRFILELLCIVSYNYTPFAKIYIYLLYSCKMFYHQPQFFFLRTRLLNSGLNHEAALAVTPPPDIDLCPYIPDSSISVGGVVYSISRMGSKRTANSHYRRRHIATSTKPPKHFTYTGNRLHQIGRHFMGSPGAAS